MFTEVCRGWQGGRWEVATSWVSKIRTQYVLSSSQVTKKQRGKEGGSRLTFPSCGGGGGGGGVQTGVRCDMINGKS